MAITATRVDQGGNASAPTGITTASVTPTALRLQLLTVNVRRTDSTQPVAPSSVTGCGVTWVPHKTNDFLAAGTNRHSAFVYRALGTPTTGTVTVTLGYTANAVAYVWDEIDGVDTTGTSGANAIRQMFNGAGSSSSPAANLGYIGSGVATYAAIGWDNSARSVSAGSGYALVSASVGTATNCLAQSQFKATGTTADGLSLSGSAEWGQISIELQAPGFCYANLAKKRFSVAGTSFATASITPSGNNRLLLAFVSWAGNPTGATPTVSGLGLTWVQIGSSSIVGQKGAAIFRALGTPTPGTVTADFAGNSQLGGFLIIDEISGTDQSGSNGSGAVVQSAAVPAGAGATPTATLAAFANASNGAWGGFATDNAPSVTAGSGFTLLQSDSFAGPNWTEGTEFKGSNDTTVDLTWGSSVGQTYGFGIEVAAGAVPISVSANALHTTAHLASVPIAVAANALHPSHHLAPAAAPRLTAVLHSTVHLLHTNRIVADLLHVTIHVPVQRPPLQATVIHSRLHAGHVDAPVYAGAPFTYPGGFPPPVVHSRPLEFHLLGRDGHDFGTLTKDRNRHFQHVLNDVGSGQAEVRPTDPLAASLIRGRILSAHVNGFGPVFDFLLEPSKHNLLKQDEEAGEGVIVGGRGTLAFLEDARIHPQRLTGPPVEKVIVIDYSHPAYDASAWIPATEIADQGNNPTVLWKGKPAQWNVPQAVWIWSADGSAADAPGPADRWFRFEFAITPGKYVVQIAGDNAYLLSMNGIPIVSAGDLLKTTGAFWRSQRIPIDIPAGTNVFGIHGQNYAPTVPGANPAGVLLALTRVDADGIEVSTMFYTNSTWTTFPDLSDGAFPSVTVGMAMIWFLERAQAAGGLAHGTWDFTATHDSAGNPWDPVPAITMNVGDDYLAAFLKLRQAGLCDLQTLPGSPLKLQAFRPGEMVPASTATFDTPDLLELETADPPNVVNAYLVQYDSGYFTVEDAASIAANGRIEGYLAMGNLTADEALSRVTAQLALTKDPQRSQITVRLTRAAAVRPYETYGVGSLVPTRQEDGSVAAERITSISVADNGDEIDVIPTLRDRILDSEDRIEQWLKTMADGTQAGIFQGSSIPPITAIPASALSNETELIHQSGVVTLGSSPRHPIRRTGTARMFFVFIGGLLDVVNVDVDCYIDDVRITSATVIAGQRRSPLIVFDPPKRVDEFEDFWSILITSGSVSSEISAHMIIA